MFDPQDAFQADKAVIAIHAARAAQPRANRVGPNRDDAPLFARLVQGWERQAPQPKSDTLRARRRVRKYERQIKNHPWLQYITDPDTTRTQMLQIAATALQVTAAERELDRYIKDQRHYGAW